MDRERAAQEYENRMNSSDGTVSVDDILAVCAAGRINDKNKCNAFQKDLITYFYSVCDSDKGKSKGSEHCINNFFYYVAPKNLSFGKGTYVRTKEAVGLAKEYALIKDKQNVVCTSALGKSKKTNTVWCTSVGDTKHFYEFKFNNITETKDDYIRQSLLRSVCKIHNTEYSASGVGATTVGTVPGYSWPDSCETADKSVCAKVNKSLGRFSYRATIGTTDAPPAGKRSACIIEKVVNEISDLRSAYGIDPTVFKNVQALAGEDIDKKIKQYVKQELQKQKITFNEKSFYCATSTNVLNGGEVLTCYVNDKPIDFLFKDLSEWIGVNKRGGAQAMDCIVSGGTFTGKKCIGLGKEQCEIVRAANAISCPECKQIKWNSETNICELPASASAVKLQRGLNYTVIVGGTVVGIVITVGTLGTASAPTVVILGGVGLETTGSVIELIAQMRIDEKADKFFTQSANCKNQTCAEKLIKDYLQELANQSDSLLDSELTTADEEFARLFDLIPSDAEFYTKIIEYGIRGETVESNKRGLFDAKSWNSEQIWRAVGVTLQVIPTLASIGWRIAKKSDKLVRSTAKLRDKLELTSKHIDNLLNVRKADSIINAMSVRVINQVRDNGHVSVFKFIDDASGQTYYLKHTDELEEIIRTKRAYEILNGKSDIVHTVRVFEDNQNVLKDFAKKHNLSTSSGKYWFLMEEMPGSQTAINLTWDVEYSLNTVLGGKPVTIAEQKEILKAIDDLNAGGIVHGDLHSNMFFTREPNGKLRVDIIDYEPWSAQQAPMGQDKKNVEYMFKILSEKGLAEDPSKIID